MPGRIVLFGATGYTGQLVAEALVARDARPLLAGRSQRPLDDLAKRLGGLSTQLADVEDPDSVRALVEPGDVLVSTVGPFARYGRPALEAAINAGADYVDSTGEGPFIREVFEQWGPQAQAAGCTLLTAFGYDWVPGHLAAGLALEQAGETARRVEVGYFASGGTVGMSGGTRASAAGVLSAPGYAWRDGRIVAERPGRRRRTFEIGGRERQAISVASSEHFGVPRFAPQIRDVDVYLGWFGGASRAVQGFSALASLPPVAALVNAGAARLVRGSTGGPTAEERSRSRSLAQALVLDASGRELARVTVEGPNGYTFTGEMLAWGAMAAASGALGKVAGARGPLDAFGLEALRAGCAEAGLLPLAPA